MTDFEAIHEEVIELRRDADREVGEALASIEEALANMEAGENAPKADRLQEVRAELDRLASETDGETAARLDRVRRTVQEYQREWA